jgi:hypothetical protein
MRQDLLYRLRWNIFGSIDDIQFMDGITPVLSSTHSVAKEPLCSLPTHHLRVHIYGCMNKHSSQYEYEPEDRNQAPAPLAINEEGKKGITIGQCITQVHAYLNTHEQEIRKVVGETYGVPMIDIDGQQIYSLIYGKPVNLDGVRFWFNWVPLGLHSYGDGKYSCNADLWAEGYHGMAIEAYFEKRS